MERLVHGSAKADPSTGARHGAFIAMLLATALSGLLLVPPFLAIYGGPNMAAGTLMMLSASLLGIVWRLSTTGRLDVAALLAALALCGFSILTGWQEGGHAGLALVTLMTVPLVAMLTGARNIVVRAAMLASAAAIAILLSGHPIQPPASAAGRLLDGLGALLAINAAGAIVLVELRLRRYDRQLVKSGEARYTLLAENISDLVTRHGKRGQVVYASPASQALLGVEPADLLGQGLFDHVHIADRPAYLSALSSAEMDGLGSVVEFRLRRKGEGAPTFLWVEMRCRPLGEDDERQTVAVMQDITDRKAYEHQLIDAKIEAEKANAAKSRFLATMSHELRTPLNAIIGFSELMLNEEMMRLSAERRHEYAGLIHDSGHHLLSMVNGILDMSKIESGSFELVAESFSLRDLVENCRNILLLKAQELGISLEMAMNPDMPPIIADKRACRQIYLNLMSNALKFTKRGGHVTIGARQEKHGVALFVADDGVGVAREDVPRLGEAFFQSTAGKPSKDYERTYEGTGLGLSVVKGLAQLHGGRMEVESLVGQGTTVTVLLPMDCENEASRRAFAGGAIIETLPLRPVAQDHFVTVEELGKKRA
ncbi:sensor histidine kinase [Labrys monachus]|uniref:histidine kinase n=1 Tax=Labrys monachus TaxID=217067 RepID=A0ABU0FJA7_9HYPH|nr:PAS domain-containing sensor histidine kinase [Labrys monachus]MDQ0394561.1 cell cycle sensor histidine kinase DivJ [Labrys monachus]